LNKGTGSFIGTLIFTEDISGVLDTLLRVLWCVCWRNKQLG